MREGSEPQSFPLDQARSLIPVFALAIAVVAAVADPWSSAGDVIWVAIAVGAFAFWAYVPRVPLPALALIVLGAVVLAQRAAQLEPLLFEASLLAFVVGGWARSLALAVVLGVAAALSPVIVSMIQDPSEMGVHNWVLGIVFPWVLGRAIARQRELAIELDAMRRRLAERALVDERRRVARDVHDFVGHGLAAVLLHLTGARHVLRRDPDSAEEALAAAEEVGRRSMNELRRTVAVLRSDDEARASPPPSASEIPGLVDRARDTGLAVELRTRGDPSELAPSSGAALYRIAQETLANAARHAPRARTVLQLEVGDRHVRLVAETTGPTVARAAGERERPRHGVVGMRERARALGGELTAGPTRAGWRVSCRLPLAVSEATPTGEAA